MLAKCTFLSSSGRDGITKYLPGGLHRPVGGFYRGTFHPMQHLERIRYLDLRDGPASEPWKYVKLKAPDDFFCVIFGPSLRLLRVPLACHDLERVFEVVALGLIRRLPVLARVNAVRQQPPRFVTPLSRDRKRDAGVYPERQTFFFLVEAVFESPPLAPGRCDFEVKPRSSEILKGFSLGFAPLIFMSVMAMWGQVLATFALLPHILPPVAPGCKGIS